MTSTPESRLLQLYDRISDAPDAIPRLRRFVLDLAVRGKLVEQDPNDEPAEELLKRIAAEKARLVNAGKIRKPKSTASIDTSELPISVPSCWAWLRLRDIGTLSGGMTPSKSRPDYWDGDVVWLSPKDIKADEVSDSELKITTKGLNETRLELFPEGSLFIVARSGILKRTFPVTINRVPAASNQDLKVMVPYLKGQERYLQIMFRGMTDFLLTQLVKQGTTVQSLKYAEFEVQPFPLPPLAEQRRIVAKVDELMTLLDRLEAARTARKTTRDRLTTVSLTRLTAPEADPADFPTNARFALDALPALTKRPNQIKTLRQTILNLAVRGKLVEQDPTDQPASELLKRIACDKKGRAVSARDRRAGAIKSLDRSELSFDVPASWDWVTFGDITISRDGERVPVSKAERENRAKIYDYYGASGVIDKIDGYLFDKPLLLIGEDGANLINRSTPIAFIARGKYWVNNHAHVLDGLSEQFLRYLELFINATDLKPFTTGTAQPKMNQAKMNSIPVALPPLPEQHRIVAKVDALMALCDRLEATLTTVDTSRARLLEALLHEALRSSSSNRKAA